MLNYRVEIYYTNREMFSIRVKGQPNLLLVLQEKMNEYVKHVVIAVFKDER